MKLESFRVFIAVADAQSLVLAAKQLNKTPSGLSMALKNLETQIGAPLFASERKNQLTALGQWVLTRARHDVAQFDATVRWSATRWIWWCDRTSTHRPRRCCANA
ncbi:LysR family transcriptional regulator [Litorivicinus lipolyticus]|uniref:LysR family transcriptional regulator n=1 Tax=Litorivicinus lipolyticus TaxID=418701 RepID=A0A5Q2Q7I0_9GAMM|nr:LysR family transcriptional regulator [Litorivicinus lipolyticus]QGG80439.1 LysR family transcriptional regulator [Litorivicinus lipolyticus]